ncbi:hypothetical protein ACFL6I_12215 [candidate division KSB1 bacterium]
MRDKVVWCDSCTEVSGTAKVGTDEQEPDKRHGKPDMIAQHIKVQTQEAKCLLCRSGSDRPKEDALTRGGLGLGLELLCTKKSAEAIIPNRKRAS